jgi:hypothetical protein
VTAAKANPFLTLKVGEARIACRVTASTLG